MSEPTSGIQTFSIHEKLYSLNEYRNEHFHKLNKLKVSWSNTIHLLSIYHSLKPVQKCKIEFELFFKDKRKRDLDNYSATIKMILDGLVQAGIIQDDNYSVVEEITIRCGGQAKTEHIKVTIKGDYSK